jgi:benzoyl-CoA reductase/2-hydroxyglutaryl-CoA dehydratase subunit BcrC/BadD/HgdB
MNRVIGITSTIPSEVIYAAGYKLCDLNNLYIKSRLPMDYYEKAEIAGFPGTYCGWIKGLYSAALDNDIRTVIAVTEGDCSNTHALMELYTYENVNTIPFAYPFIHDREHISFEISSLMKRFNVVKVDLDIVREKFYKIRQLLHKFDENTYSESKISGKENHIWLVSSSDFNGNPDKFYANLKTRINEIDKKTSIYNDYIRLGYAGVPPIFTDFYETVENLGGHIVFNELQRQFAMPSYQKDMVSQYLDYTYPYSIFLRIEDIKTEIKKRKIKGLIHYVQSFCYRTLEDVILRKELNIPILTIEGDKPEKTGVRTRIRIEAFIEMLRKL